VKLNGNPLLTVFVVSLAASLGASHNRAWAKDCHYRGPNPKLVCTYIDNVVSATPDSTVDEFWVFSSVADHTLSDPDRPPWVLGTSGPWNVTGTHFDPFGNFMPYLGLRFTLADGGIPIGPAGGAFCHPSLELPPGVEGVITDYWTDSASGIQTASGVPAQFYLDIPADVDAQGAPAAYQYIWDAYSVPEPASLLLFAAAARLLIRRR
jgi:hypothetical protein